METIRLNFEITRGDLEEVCRSQRDFQRVFPRYLVFGSLWLIGAIIKFLTAPLLYNQGFVYLLFALPLLSLAAFKPKWLAHRFFKQEKDWHISYDINAGGTMIYWVDADDPTHKWSEYQRLEETKNLMLLCGDEDEGFQIIPKRAFANAAELEQFRSWASSIGQKDEPLAEPIPKP